ncbi:unnamed protein product, partial [marine sediment metagenome]
MTDSLNNENSFGQISPDQTENQSVPTNKTDDIDKIKATDKTEAADTTKPAAAAKSDDTTKLADKTKSVSASAGKSQQLSAAEFVAKRRERLRKRKAISQAIVESKLQEKQPLPSPPNTLGQVDSGSVAIPMPSDEELEKEIEQALGDMSLMNMYGLEESQASTQQTPVLQRSSENAATDGIVAGKIVAVGKEGVFIDLGGKSQGFLPIEELEGVETPSVGSSIKVVIIRYDARDGLLIVSQKIAQQQLFRKNLNIG